MLTTREKLRQYTQKNILFKYSRDLFLSLHFVYLKVLWTLVNLDYIKYYYLLLLVVKEKLYAYRFHKDLFERNKKLEFKYSYSVQGRRPLFSSWNETKLYRSEFNKIQSC